MIKNCKVYLVFLFLSVALVSYSQTAKILKKANLEFAKGNYSKASRMYYHVFKVDTTNEEVNYQMSRAYVEMSKGKQALRHINLAIANQAKASQKYLYIKARGFHLTHKLDSAIIYYKKSDPYNKNKREISKKLQECNYGIKLMASPKKYRLKNIKKVNSKYHDIAPKITADGRVLYYTSQKSQATYPEDIYVALNRGGAWTTGISVGAPLNTEVNDACLGLSPDGQTMYIYKGVNGGDIYESKLKGKKWSKPVAMPFNTPARETSISVSPDEKELYFVRQSLNAEGQKVGNSNIYICRKNASGRWSKPTKLNSNINTIYDEESPYIHADGLTMYFSSKGHNSMGGYDIFMSKKVNGAWTKAINLGYPLNTAADERNFVLEADGKYGFYAAEKEKGGKGGLDVYHISMPPSKKPNLALVSGKVIDEITKAPVEAKITITDNSTALVVAEFHSNSATGEYLISLPAGKNYGITIEKEGHLFHSENFQLTKSKGFKNVKKNVSLLSMKPGSKVVLQNIFFATGSYELSQSSNAELTKLYTLLKNNPGIKIMISGHTDNVGNAENNLTLSSNRATSVKKFLIAKGINKSRIVSKGFGSTKPIASNDTKQGRKKNRRTEFTITQ